MALNNIEFFTYEGEVWYRNEINEVKLLRESDTQIVTELIEFISTFYPKAYEALCQEYKGCVLNKTYHRFRMAIRFIRCNLSKLDNIPDFKDDCHCNFEYVQCPLRGECKFENIICRPEFDHKLSSAELPALRLWAAGDTIEEIAEQLHLSPHTINNHIRHAYQRLNIHSKSEFVKYASQNNLFD